MTRKLTLFLASMLIAFTAEATTPMNGTATTDQQSATLTTEEGEDDGYWWGASFDLASNYIWRGYDQSYRGGDRYMFDPSLQPGVTLGYGNFFIDLWYNISLASKYNEFDFYLGYENDNLTITLYDVFCGIGSEFTDLNPFELATHNLTATFDYTFFDSLRLHWSTTLIRADDKYNGKQAYSSYLEVAYNRSVCDLFDVELAAGASPWAAPYWCSERDMETTAKGFNVTNLSLICSKEFEADNFTFPVKFGYIYNPTTNFNYLYLQTGIAF